jgi:predicted AlkP superfamily phosphohydrolase/phosphomutase
MGDNATRVLAIGLDGASFELLGSWLRAGDMPNLARLVARGVSGGLESVVPPLTPPAWTSAVTGVNPGKHGVFNFLRPSFEPGAAEFYGSADWRSPALWDLLGARGLRSVVLHLPATYPPRPLAGALVAGLPLTNLDANSTYPAGLKDELRERIPGYRLFPDTMLLRTDRDAYFRDAMRTLAAHTEEALFMMGREPWSFFFTLWHMGDSLKHYFWDDMLRKTEDEHRRFYIRDYYREVDRSLGRVLERAGEDATVLVLSDHGHQGVRRAVHLNGWLARNGYLKVRIPASLARGKLLKKVERKLRGAFGMRKRVEAIAGDNDPAFAAAARTLETMGQAVVWSETTAYAEPPGFVWLNVKGRNAAGIVDPGADYARVRDEIRRGLLAIEDADADRKVLDAVVTREEAFDGPATAVAPDLIALPREGYITEYGVQHRNDVGPARPVGFNGYHVMRGMFALAGPDVRAGETLDGARILDVAPTILYLLGLPVQPGMDGRVLENALAPELLAARPVAVEEIPVDLPAPPSAADERESIERSLKDLGYM